MELSNPSGFSPVAQFGRSHEMLGFGGEVLSVVGHAVRGPPKRSEIQFAVSNTEADLPGGIRSCGLEQARALGSSRWEEATPWRCDRDVNNNQS